MPRFYRAGYGDAPGRRDRRWTASGRERSAGHFTISGFGFPLSRSPRSINLVGSHLWKCGEESPPPQVSIVIAVGRWFFWRSRERLLPKKSRTRGARLRSHRRREFG